MKNSLLTLVVIIVLSSCGTGGEEDKLVTIKTEKGNMTVLLYDEMPIHKANFLKLAESGEYDSTIFHRVIEGFMIQGGDIFRGAEVQEAEVDRLPAEIKEGFFHTRGALAAARQGDQINPEKKSSSCQFYIVDGQPWSEMSIDLNMLYGKINALLLDSVNNPELFAEFRRNKNRTGYSKWVVTKKSFVEEKFGIELDKEPTTGDNAAYEAAGGGSPFLDEGYTVFGRVVEGLDIIDEIAGVQTGEGDLPVESLYIQMEVEPMAKSEITKKYGYEYPEATE